MLISRGAILLIKWFTEYRSFDKQTKNWKITNLHIEEFKQHLKKSKIYFEYVTF
jgi:hypothetical protein